MIKILYRSLKDSKIHTSRKSRRGIWVRVEDPTELELENLIEDYDLDEAIVKDALDPYEVPRIEKEDGAVYCIIRLPTASQATIVTIPLLIIVTPQVVITVSKNKLELLDTLILEKIAPVITTQKTKLLMQLLQLINAEFEKQLFRLAKDISLHTTDTEKIENARVIQFVVYETQYNTYLATLNPMKLVLEKLRSNKFLALHEDDNDLIEDLLWNADQLIQMSLFGIKQVTNIREAYSTIVSNNLNKTVKVLTSVTVILTIPTIVSSFFGMNVPVPLSNHVFGFLLIAIFTIVAVVFLYYIFHKKDLL
jgi:magnesium transporter